MTNVHAAIEQAMVFEQEQKVAEARTQRAIEEAIARDKATEAALAVKIQNKVIVLNKEVTRRQLGTPEEVRAFLFEEAQKCPIAALVYGTFVTQKEEAR